MEDNGPAIAAGKLNRSLKLRPGVFASTCDLNKFAALPSGCGDRCALCLKAKAALALSLGAYS
jgi:hypothetical protein